MAADVTVSIVNHESRDSVLKSLRALAHEESRTARIQVLVVDNASQDGSVDTIRAEFPDVEVIARRDRGGYGANHNLALARAEGRHMLFLNDDARVLPGAIDALTAYLDSHPDVAVGAPTLVSADGSPQVSLWPVPTPAQDVFGALRFGLPRPLGFEGRRAQPIGWAMGAALFVRAGAARAAGGFDEGYFMYSEEVDLCMRLRRFSGAIHWVPGARVVHEGQGSTEDSQERAIEMARSRRRYQELHYSAAGRRLAQFAIALQFFVLALAARVRGRPARAFALQAVGAWREPGGPGLRERAEAFNRTRPQE